MRFRGINWAVGVFDRGIKMQNTKEVLKLEDFNLSSRVLWLLARNNIDRVKLTSITYNELKAIPTMGNEKISEIKRELE